METVRAIASQSVAMANARLVKTRETVQETVDSSNNLPGNEIKRVIDPTTAEGEAVINAETELTTREAV